MPLLAIETSGRQLGVALRDGERLLASYELLVPDYPHAAELPDAVKRVMKAAGTSLDRLEAIAVDIGPGSFTGLRIGLARGLVGMIIGEFIGGSIGLGYAISRAGQEFEVARILAITLILMLIATISLAILAWTKRRFAPWAQD